MNTKVLLGTSAGLMAAGGLVLQLAPHEVLAYASYPATGLAPVLVQVLGALYLGFALPNWMSKGVAMSGIYTRPLAMGSGLHFLVGAFTGLHYAQRAPVSAGAWGWTAGYALLAELFGAVLFVSPHREAMPARG